MAYSRSKDLGLRISQGKRPEFNTRYFKLVANSVTPFLLTTSLSISQLVWIPLQRNSVFKLRNSEPIARAVAGRSSNGAVAGELKICALVYVFDPEIERTLRFARQVRRQIEFENNLRSQTKNLATENLASENNFAYSSDFDFDFDIPFSFDIGTSIMGDVQRVTLKTMGDDGATWPSIPGRISKKILNKDAWMWMKLVVCNLMPTRHETTLGVDHIMINYALMKGMSLSLPEIMVTAMNEDPTKSKKQLLQFPMFITKWAEKAGVPTYPGDEILNIPKAQQFFPYGLWKEERETVANPIPPPMPSLAARTNIPSSSNVSSPEPSKKELMRALRRNERIMHRHVQLLLLIHPDTDISQLERVSSPEVSEH
ncbi:hypothetical protein PIB30_054233 [Stylosanthes scabra]|uniref:Putative plant transposon protein domain-containing protein n=1 Tax=Stylosanthes scabra TaxID=79078 RepID=A0ABU6XGH9_9FABA|nr:hypothetical protein [Stylosanthes scabra]